MSGTFLVTARDLNRLTYRSGSSGSPKLGLIHGPRSELIVPAIFMPAPGDGAFQAGETFHGSDQHPK